MDPVEPFSARVEAVGDECRVVLVGDVDLAAVPELFARLQEADRAPGRLVVLMNAVTLIDSSGLGVLARLAAADVHLEIRGAAGVVRRALDISGVALSPNIRIADDPS